MPHSFNRLESFGHDELTANYCYFRCSGGREGGREGGDGGRQAGRQGRRYGGT